MLSLLLLLTAAACHEEVAPSQTGTPAPSPAVSLAPIASASPVSAIVQDDAPLTARIENRDDGFAVKLEDASFASVLQTVVSADRNMPVVHLVRRLTALDDVRQRYRLDLVAIDPDDRSVRVYPLVDLALADTYAADSLAFIRGFADPAHLVLTKLRQSADSSALLSDIALFDIRSGKTETLIEAAVPIATNDFVAVARLSASRDKLVLNSFTGGKLWIADLQARTIRSPERLFRNHWPLANLYLSPDGERFWYPVMDVGLKLYDTEGRELATIAADGGLREYPPLKWSPSGNYALEEYTLTDSGEHVFYGEEGVAFIAAQAMRIYDRDGGVVWRYEQASADEFFEWSGWLPGSDSGVLRSYGLQQRQDQPPQRTNVSYRLTDIASGSMTTLARASSLEQLDQPQAFATEEGDILFVDAANARIVSLHNTLGSSPYAELLTAPDDATIVWAVPDWEQQTTSVYRYDRSTRTTTVTKWSPAGNRLQLVDDAYTVDSELVYHLLHKLP